MKRRIVALCLMTSALAHAGLGLTELPGTSLDGPITVYYPTAASEQSIRRGPFSQSLAQDGDPLRGNAHLVIISHGSGAAPWVHTDLARNLVLRGFTVAMPEHRGDNYKDPGQAGPVSWQLRPAEVSRAIDAIGQSPQFKTLLDLRRVGVFGYSAGGHTALALAGGRWAPARFKAHCEAHIAEDFHTCVGLTTRLTGGWTDELKKWLALLVHQINFSSQKPLTHHDPRIAAAVAAAPIAAVFDMASLTAPALPLGLITLENDLWLVPRFHSTRVLQACTGCVEVAHIPRAGHGAMLSPLPPGFTGLTGDLLNDPPDFDRAQLSGVHDKVADFFEQHLLLTPQN